MVTGGYQDLGRTSDRNTQSPPLTQSWRWSVECQQVNWHLLDITRTTGRWQGQIKDVIIVEKIQIIWNFHFVNMTLSLRNTRLPVDLSRHWVWELQVYSICTLYLLGGLIYIINIFSKIILLVFLFYFKVWKFNLNELVESNLTI